MKLSPASLLAYASLARLTYAQARKCYFPNGEVSIEDHPCDPAADESVCCGPPSDTGGACLSNKLCYSPKTGRTSRGSCTDADWSSPACLNFCTVPLNAGHEVLPCSNVTGTDSYCCHKDNVETGNCCSWPALRKEFGVSPPFTWAVWVASETGFVVATPLSTSTSTSTASSSIASSSASISPSPPPQSSSTTSTSNGLPAQATSGSSDPGQVSATAQSPGLTTGAQAGIGVGAAIGALLIAALAYILWKLNRTNKLMEEALRQQWMAEQSQVAAGQAKTELPGQWTGHELSATDPPSYELPAEHHYLR